MGVFCPWRNTLYVLWEREFHNGDIGVFQRSTDGRGVSGGGEDGDGGGPLPEKAAEVEERDSVALSHERKDGKVYTRKRSHS